MFWIFILLFRPSCCATNIKAAFVLGIVLVILSVLVCFEGSLETIINGILCGIIHCILIFGTHARNSTAVLVWMVLAILSCIGNAIMAVMAIIVIAHEGAGVNVTAVSVVPIVFFIGIIIFEIWTIIVARNARKEIEADENEEDDAWMYYINQFENFTNPPNFNSKLKSPWKLGSNYGVASIYMIIVVSMRINLLHSVFIQARNHFLKGTECMCEEVLTEKMILISS